MKTTGISRHVRHLLEEKGVQMPSFKYFVERRLLSKHWPCNGLVFFSTSVANETENLNIWFKLNQWAKTQ